MGGLLLGLDAGGRSVRCSLVDVETGDMVTASRAWRPCPAPGCGFFAFRTDTDLCARLIAECVRDALRSAGAAPSRILGIAATGMRFSLVLVDARGQTLFATPNHDARAAAEGIRLADDLGPDLHRRTGHWPNPIFLAPRLLWLAENAPEILAQATSAFALNDWIAFTLTGKIATDPTQAGETLLFDLVRRSWAWDLVDELDLPRHLFPEVRPCGSLLGGLTRQVADALGLLEGTPVMIGGADTQCGLLGSGVVEPGGLGVVAGSTAPLQLVVGGPVTDPDGRLWTGQHAVPSRWVVESNAGAMGDTLEWFAGVLYPESPHAVAHLTAEAGRAAPGAGGIVSSLGAEVMNGRDMSLPVGTVSLTHLDLQGADSVVQGGDSRVPGNARRANLVRSVLEGMAYAVRANVDQLEALTGIRRDHLTLAGGMTQSRLWTQTVCDVLGSQVQVSTVPGASVLGAAMCAGVGAGAFPDLDSAAKTLARTKVLTPDRERSAAYQDLFASWDQLRTVRAPADRLAAGIALETMMSRPAAESAAASAPPRLRILVTSDLDEQSLAELEHLGEVTHASYREAMRLLTGEDLVDALQGYDVLVTEVDIVDAEALARLPDLRVVATCRGNAVNVDLEACTALGIPVLYAPGRNAEAVADLTLAFMLALARKLVAADAFLRMPGGEVGDMGRMGHAHEAFLGRELSGTTVGLIGFGAVGRAVARRLRPFGARVLVHDPLVPEDDILLMDAEPAELDELLSSSDIVSLHAPVTDQTRGLINEQELARMKRGALLVNTARAALIDETALVAALSSGHLGGAALDVFASEPPGVDDALLGLPNVIATPHLGGNTVEVAAHQGQIIAADLNCLVSGLPPRNVLNTGTLSGFSWTAVRPSVDPAVLASLSTATAPSVTDLQQPSGNTARAQAVGMTLGNARTHPSEGAPGAMDAQSTNVGGAPSARDQMERVLAAFVARAATDPVLAQFATGRTVSSQYTVSDLGLDFHIGFRDGRVQTGLGPPPEPADVRLKAKAQVLDSILTGRLNGNKAAMTGKLSFSGDVRLAMGMQRIQSDMVRLYSAARDEAGGIDFSATLEAPPAAPPASSPSPPSARPAAVRSFAGSAVDSGASALREELTCVTEEMFAAQLLTATGGNISVRIPEADQAWITPSQLFKGSLTPEMMVRIDLEGNALDPDALAPSSERLLHCEIYRARPDVEAIMHAHAAYLTILGMSGLPFLPVTTEAAFLSDIPRVPFIMPGSRELAVAVRKALGDGMAVLLQNHGLVVAAGSLRQATNTAEVVERVSQLIWGCYAVGKKPPTLPKDVLATLREIGRMMA